MFNNKARLFLLFIVYFQANLAHGNDRLDNLFDLTMDELMEISIASKKSENVEQAPGIVTVVTKQEISSFGARHLRDVLDRLVNMQVIGSNLYPHNRLSIRGVTQTHTDNKVLLLFNGRVVRDANQGGLNTDIYNLFPIEFVERVEIIRGPGSALYGTNAFSGVVNIVTTNEDESSVMNLSLGERGSHSLSTQLHLNGDNYRHQIGVKHTDFSGSHFQLNGEFGTSGTYTSDKQAKQLILHGYHGNFSYNTFISDSIQGNVKSLYQFPSSELDVQRRHIDLGYANSIWNDWALNVNFTYNYHQIAFDISNTRSTRTDSQSLLWDIYASKQLSESYELLIGASYELLKGTIGNISVTPTPFETYRKGFYSQLIWHINESSNFVIGGQINDAEFTSSDISPRISYTNKLNSDWSIKLLYGEAFRSPFATDMFLDSPTLKGNPELQPETIATWDVQITRNVDSQLFSLSVYHSQHENLHVRQLVNEIPTFINSGEMEYQGIELELKQNLADKTQLIVNASYQQSTDDNNTKGVTFNPETMIKMGLSHQINNGISINLFNSYYSAASELTSLGFQPVTNNAEVDSYNLITANLLLNIGEVFNNNKYNAVDISIYLDNITDERIYFPSFNRPNVSSFPHHDERSILLNLSYRF